MPKQVEKERLTKNFKGFMNVYKQTQGIKVMLKQRIEQKQQSLRESEEMLDMLEQQQQRLIQAAPEPTDQLQEQGET